MARPVDVLIALWSTAAVAGPATPAERAGRVERIERSSSRPAVAPRLCEIRADSGTCVGEEPRPGQTVIMLDERGVTSEVQLLEVTSFVPACDNLWSVKTRALRGETAGDGIGVIDAGVHPGRAHMLDKRRMPASPSGVPGEEVWRAIDGDGDGEADIVITRYNCDTAGRPVAGGATYCIDVWARTGPQPGARTVPETGPHSGPRMTRTTQLNFAQCNL